MIGPSAPNGPPVPIAMAAEIGFRIATFGSIRLRLVSTASILPERARVEIVGELDRLQVKWGRSPTCQRIGLAGIAGGRGTSGGKEEQRQQRANLPATA